MIQIVQYKEYVCYIILAIYEITLQPVILNVLDRTNVQRYAFHAIFIFLYTLYLLHITQFKSILALCPLAILRHTTLWGLSTGYVYVLAIQMFTALGQPIGALKHKVVLDLLVSQRHYFTVFNNRAPLVLPIFKNLLVLNNLP